VLAVGNPEGWGMALKISDGSHRAVRPVALAVLAHRGVKVGDGEAIVRGLHGETVGEIGPLI
jgi:L-asparaginase II